MIYTYGLVWFVFLRVFIFLGVIGIQRWMRQLRPPLLQRRQNDGNTKSEGRSKTKTFEAASKDLHVIQGTRCVFISEVVVDILYILTLLSQHVVTVIV